MKRNCLILNVRRHLTTALSLLVLAGGLGAFAAQAAELPPLGHQMNPITPAIEAPAFELPDMDGELHTLEAYRGKVVMLNFWATWCPPCRREMPSMQRLYDKYAERGLTVVAVNQWEDPDLVFEFTGRLSVDPTFPILFDRDSRVAEAYKVKGLPTTYLLDRDGRIRYQAIGGREFDHPEVERLIEGLL
ncbi:TlpA family protein disulfide reductase [Thiosocius teredinicola]|uniref:TlpA family protein disulfide reductase n=1 Tax=Thiosocius teredinicola TaxID=1973002 RepID=UPI000990F04A